MNVSMDTAKVRSSTGRLFHVARPDTVKFRRPIVVLVRGTTSVPLSVDRICHLPTVRVRHSQGPLQLYRGYPIAMASQLGTIPIPNPITNPIHNPQRSSYSGPQLCRADPPPLPTTDDRDETVIMHVSQVGRRRTVKAFVGNYRQFEGDSLPCWKPVELSQHWSNVVKLPC